VLTFNYADVRAAKVVLKFWVEQQPSVI
jgi:hypothetical protein